MADSVERLAAAALTLGDRLGPILFQLPPFLKKDLPRLEAFLATLPPSLNAPPSSSATLPGSPTTSYAALKARDAALCVADSEDLSTPLESTASWGYLRLRRQDYDDAALAGWAERLARAAARRHLRLLQTRGRRKRRLALPLRLRSS